MLAVGLAGCRQESTVALRTPLPAEATTLPGNTMVLWLPGADELAGLRPPLDWLDPLAERGVQLRELPDQGLAAVAEPVRVGWSDLAASRPFQEAWAEVPEGARGVGYVDLQILFDLATGEWSNTPFERVIDVLGIRAGIAAVVWGEPGEGAISAWRGTLLSTGSRTGIFALLGGEAPATLLADGDGPELRVDGRFDTRTARRMLWDLLADEGRMSGSDVLTQVGGPMLEMLRDLLRHLDGRFAVRARSPRDFDAAFGVEDARGLARDLSEIARELDEGTWQLPGGSRFVRIEGDRLVLLTEEDAESPPPGEPLVVGEIASGEPAPGLRVEVPRGFVGDDPGALLELWQIDRRRTELRLRVDPGTSGR